MRPAAASCARSLLSGARSLLSGARAPRARRYTVTPDYALPAQGQREGGFNVVAEVIAAHGHKPANALPQLCLLYTSPSPRDAHES
eukprot:1573700-Prymnesium_polylepis.1